MSVAEPAAGGLETAALERLYERNASRVFGYCLKMLGSREEAEDASQTTFMQAFRALQRGVVPAFEQAWLLTIAKNVCLARHRASGRRRAVELVRDPQDLEVLAGGPDQEDVPLAGLQAALARLPEMQRRAFLLREWQGRSYAEIALELGVTLPAVEALIFRARRALATELGDGERRRGHGFDLASLVASLKTLLGGGAAVKLAAVGVAAAVGAGVIASEGVRRNDSPAPVRAQHEAQPSPPTEKAAVRGALAPGSRRPARSRASSAPRRLKPVTRAAVRPPTATPAPEGASAQNGPDAPHESAPAASKPAETPAPNTPALPDAPTLPEVPTVPVVSEVVEDLPVPKVELPPLPTDQLPVEVPRLPELPDVPGLPQLP